MQTHDGGIAPRIFILGTR